MSELTVERLRELLTYDPETGVFFWKEPGRGRPRNRPAGTFDAHGYRQIGVGKRRYKSHRMAWMYVHGAWPSLQLRHINGVRDDNQIANLREATGSRNRGNMRGHRSYLRAARELHGEFARAA